MGSQAGDCGWLVSRGGLRQMGFRLFAVKTSARECRDGHSKEPSVPVLTLVGLGCPTARHVLAHYHQPEREAWLSEGLGGGWLLLE